MSDEVVRPGLRDHLLTEQDAADLRALPAGRVVTAPLDRDVSPLRIARHLREVSERLIAGELEAETTQLTDVVRAVNSLIGALGEGRTTASDLLSAPPEVLLGIRRAPDRTLAGTPDLPPRPTIPLHTSDLLYNGRGQPSLGSELQLELESASRVDLICAFVIWTGLRILREPLQRFVERGGKLRVITTTYMGVTERRALDELHELGAEVKVAFEAPTTRLHAKAWLIERDAELTTAFVGSSNLSKSALHEGLEWNVRIAEADAPHLIESVRRTFASHWESQLFEKYEPDRDADRLDRSLGKHRKGGHGEIVLTGLEVHPLRHQQWMLDDLRRERERHGRHRNLLVAATGTGKTVVAALDYRGLCRKAGRDLSLLFVAHRQRILDQSRATFRAVLRDANLGEIWGGGERPRAAHHVFAMIQSLGEGVVRQLRPDEYDVVIIDEFHHAAAPSYRALLERVEPRELLGLTATPERLDGEDVTTWFDGRIAHELRVWDAIDQGFLAPFQYFGVADETDLSHLEWRRGGYRTADLERELVENDEVARRRTLRLLDSVDRYVLDSGTMRALGFCVSVAHAQYMAARFSDAGLLAAAISGETADAERNRALARLERGDLRAVFSVDVLGEGVDAPHVDTLLLLRPTDSATVFTQQLGRGLRLAPDKRCLTVIDLIGQQHRKFRFDRRFRALIDPRNGPVPRQVEAGFPILPAGCHVELDRVSRDRVLANLKQAARLTQWQPLLDDLAGNPDWDLKAFLDETERAPADLYRDRHRSWTRLRREAGFDSPAGGPDEKELLGALHRLLHVDDIERVRFYSDLLVHPRPPAIGDLDPRRTRLARMLHFAMWGRRRQFSSLEEGFIALWKNDSVRAELRELLDVLDERSETLTQPLGFDPAIPIAVHGRYALIEVLAAFGLGSPDKPPDLREGVKWLPEVSTDLFFVTLQKSERDYSPTTMYRDYAISPSLFHWESQSTTSERSPTGQRYINHAERGSHVVLFVRDRAKLSWGATSPYICLGPARYVRHEGDRPLAITWELQHEMPESLFSMARAVAAA
jgi:superfamily II DNA or RNA helicase/HKD family nuclease